MTTRTTLVLAGLLLALAGVGGGCGGSSASAQHDAAVSADAAGPADAPAPPDAGAPDDGAAPPDAGGPDDGAAGDGGPDDGAAGDGGSGGDAAGPQDGGALAQSRQFLSETSGGARRQSASYRVELFVAPVRPVGATQSGNYRMTLGPGAVRNAR